MYVDNTFEYEMGEDVVAIRTQVKGYGENFLVITRVTGICMDGKWTNPYFMNPTQKMVLETEAAFTQIHSTVGDSYATLLGRTESLISQFKRESAVLKGIVKNVQRDFLEGYSWREEEEEEIPTIGDLFREHMRRN